MAEHGHDGQVKDDSERRVIGAAFRDRAAADAAKHELHDRLDVGEDDLELGDAGGDTSARGFRAFLGARLRRGPEAEAIVRRHHGEVVANVPESHAERPLRLRRT